MPGGRSVQPFCTLRPLASEQIEQVVCDYVTIYNARTRVVYRGSTFRQPGLLRLTHPPTHPHQKNFPQEKKISKGPEIGSGF